MRDKLFFIVLLGLTFATGWMFYRAHKSQLPALPSVTHSSIFSQAEFYDQAYTDAKPSKSLPGVGGVLVNHHLLAAPFIAEALGAIATTKPVTVVLISPNHFSVGQGRILTSEAAWETPYGLLQPDLSSIRALANNGLAQVEEAPFDHEHGVTGIVAFIKKSLPNARIVPLILNDRLQVSQAQEVAKHMAALLPKDAFIVGSFDFSHYLPSRAAQFHDELSLSTVRRFDYANISRMDIDSRPGLALFLQMLAEKQATQFTLLEHTNSAELTRAFDTLETTSYLTGYFTRTDVESVPPIEEVHSALVLGRIEESPEVLAGLEPRSRHYAIEYLQRLLTGQQLTIAGAPVHVTGGVFSRMGVTHFVEKEGVYDVGSVKVAYLVEDSFVRARELIDQGSRIVCVSSKDFSIEEYNGGLIIRGLGSFLTREVLAQSAYATMVVGIAVEGDTLKVYLLPIQYQQGKAKLLVGPADDTLLATRAAQSAVSGPLKEQIKKGVLTISIK